MTISRLCFVFLHYCLLPVGWWLRYGLLSMSERLVQLCTSNKFLVLAQVSSWRRKLREFADWTLAYSYDVVCQAPTNWWRLCQGCWGTTSRWELPWTMTLTPLILWSATLPETWLQHLSSYYGHPGHVYSCCPAAVMSFSSRFALCKLLLPTGSCLASIARGRGKYLRCGAWARLSLFPPKPLQTRARISSGAFLNQRFFTIY